MSLFPLSLSNISKTYFLCSAFQAKWRGLTRHVTNKHSWVSGNYGPAECEHEPLDPEKEQREEWLEPGSDAHRTLVEVAYDHKFMENFRYYSHFRFVYINFLVFNTKSNFFFYLYVAYIPLIES